MAKEPSPHDVAQFKDFTQCQDDKLAITYLRRADFSLQAAIEHYYERLNSGDQVSRAAVRLESDQEPSRGPSTTPTLLRAVAMSQPSRPRRVGLPPLSEIV